ncbi:hypothetical protein DPMN_133774 [Dreissena polymorpha]|uniref:Uncharacterized protein n=1 Tax=Dreissena polymorpha TaxID=45954 RepID=A0A9D4FW65_DREPO|nr:hypothetical protein DPMN_133774 [Dreissena polymorpha]
MHCITTTTTTTTTTNTTTTTTTTTTLCPPSKKRGYIALLMSVGLSVGLSVRPPGGCQMNAWA